MHPNDLLLIVLASSSAIGVLILVGFYWRKPKYRDRLVRYSSICILPLGLLIGLGFTIQSTLQQEISSAANGPLYFIQSNTLSSILFILNRAAIPGIGIVSLVVALVACAKTRKSLILYATLGFPIALTIVDVTSHITTHFFVNPLFDVTSLDSLIFSIIANLVGGSILGVAMALLLLSKMQRPPIKRTKGHGRRLAFLRFNLGVVALASVVLVAGYFSFVYRFPLHLVLEAENWNDVSLKYDQPSWHVERVSKINGIIDPPDYYRNGWFAMRANSLITMFRSSTDSAPIVLHRADNTPPTVYHFIDYKTRSGVEEWNNFALATTPINAFPDVKSLDLSASIGKIEINFAAFSSNIPLIEYSLPYGETIRFRKENLDIQNVLSNRRSSIDKDPDVFIEIFRKTSTISFSARKFSISPDNAQPWRMKDVSQPRYCSSPVRANLRSEESKWLTYRCLSKSETAPTDFANLFKLAKKEFSEWTFEVLLNILKPVLVIDYGSSSSDRPEKIRVSNIGTITLRNPKFSFQLSAVLPTPVSDVYSRRFEGRLRYGIGLRDIVPGEVIFVGGGQLFIEDTAKGGFRVTGSSNYIRLNGQILNGTIWTIFTNEIYAAIIGASLGYFFSRRRRKAVN